MDHEKLTYNGVTKLVPPIAKPTMPRPATIPHTVFVTACNNAPRTKRTSATRITLRRPSLSASTPATGLAIRANKLVEDVMMLLSKVVRGRLERSEPIDTRVDDMTPVL